MSDNIISSVFSSVKWYSPTRDNAHKDAENEDNGADVGNEMLAGVSGISTDIPIIAPKSSIGASIFSFKADGLRVPNDLRDIITKHPRIKSLNEDYDNIGFAFVSGFKNGCFFYVKSDRQYAGGSVGGISVFGSDKNNTFISAGISTQSYGYNSNGNVPSLGDGSSNVDTEASYALLHVGGSNISLGAECAKHTALVDDVKAGTSVEWKARMDILDVERIFKSDTEFSLGLGASASNKGEFAVYVDSGTIRLTIRWDKTGLFRLEPLIQGGFNF